MKIGFLRDDTPAPVRAEAVLGIRETLQIQHLATGKPVVVAPVLVSTRQASREKSPRNLEGLPMVYKGDALLLYSGLAR